MDLEAYSELSLRELRVLNTLLQLRSITLTAQAMETTQPAISKMLRRLRAQFSDPLFVRNGQAMQPTAKALDLVDRYFPAIAVPLGASFFARWWNSMISHWSKARAAISAVFIIITAPMAKFEATRTLALPASAFSRMSASCSSENPVVPITQ